MNSLDTSDSGFSIFVKLLKVLLVLGFTFIGVTFVLGTMLAPPIIFLLNLFDLGAIKPDYIVAYVTVLSLALTFVVAKLVSVQQLTTLLTFVYAWMIAFIVIVFVIGIISTLVLILFFNLGAFPLSYVIAPVVFLSTILGFMTTFEATKRAKERSNQEHRANGES
ncbi:MAG: hypothetical protein GY832_05160 [Chloroflexi bacterium]|nr:hypothetical protein [Chloroflexota bacterium]